MAFYGVQSMYGHEVFAPTFRSFSWDAVWWNSHELLVNFPGIKSVIWLCQALKSVNDIFCLAFDGFDTEVKVRRGWATCRH